MFTQEDELLFAKRGITEAQVMEQLECFKKGFPYLSLDAPASVSNGIVKADESVLEEASAQWNEYLQSNHRIVKFVPASGAASRMFKNLFEFLNADYEAPATDFEKTFFAHIHSFAFYDALNDACFLNEGKGIDALVEEHKQDPGRRVLQKRLAEEVTTMIHSREEYEKAVEASQILFGQSTSEALHRLDEQTLLQVFDGVPQFKVSKADLGCSFIDLCAEKCAIFPSKGECRKMIQGGGVALNKEKVADIARTVGEEELIAGKYLLVQRGKKNYYLVIVNE